MRRRLLVVLVCVLAVGVAGCAEPREAASVAAPSTSKDDDNPQATAIGPAPAPEPAPRTAPAAGAVAVVDSVTDGDTIRLRGGARVRLVQIDTPEVHGVAECGGRAASNALRSQLPTGARVRLVADPATDRSDRYGRQLRYVYVGARNLNVWLVARGHAAPYFYDGERGRFASQLERAVTVARAGRLGMWGACPNAVLDAYRGVAAGPVTLGRRVGGAADAASGAS